MKKVITIMCLAVAPILFAQEKNSKSSDGKESKKEQVLKEQKKSQDIQGSKVKSKADLESKEATSAVKTKEVKAVDNNATLQRAKNKK